MLSLRVPAVAAPASLPLGILVAHARARWRLPGRQMLDGPVHLPLILTGIVAGAILAVARAMREFGAAITFVADIPGQTRTLPTAVCAFLGTGAASAAPSGRGGCSRI